MYAFFQISITLCRSLALILTMHMIEPFFGWRNLYIASEDRLSPLSGRTYSEFEFEHTIYNFYIHPQWDFMGSPTLFLKILFVDYDEGYAIVEFIGEWNDAIENDIMTLKRDLIEPMMEKGIQYFILIGENVLNYHYSDDCYYEEWFDEVEDGWIAMVNFHEHVLSEFRSISIDHYIAMGGELQELNWRTYQPAQMFNKVDKIVSFRLE
jgi:hypothetical protein